MVRVRPSFVIAVFFFLSMVLLSSSKGVGQSLPPFKMIMSNNEIFSVTELPKNKPVIVIYFDPDCDHCQKLMNEVFKNIQSFRKAEMVMVTFKPLAELTTFEKKYKTHNYRNVRVGTEGASYQLRDYYQLVKMPFTALYDKNQNLTQSYGQDTSVDELIRRLKQLK